jgi:ligand-binding sensor domain-containing protein
MKKIWHHLERTQERRAEAEFKSLKIPFKKRIDIVWLILVLVVFSVFILWWLVGVLLGHRFGMFDPPLARPIKDPRILINVRDNINKNPLLDAVFHEPEGYVYLSQEGGIIHGYNPSTGLWFSEKTFLQDRLINPEIILLRSGCGTDPLSYRRSLGECWDGNSLWGLTGNGGLVLRSHGEWKIIKSDSMFIGLRGQPVRQDQLTAAAVSKNNQWLLVGTEKDGIGVYHLKTGEWVQLQKDFFKNLPSPEITHITWSNNRFWIGGPGGLASLQPDRDSPLLLPNPEINGIIMDLDEDPRGRLWVLEKQSCSSGGTNCLRLSRFDFHYENQPPKVLVNEKNIFSQLTLDDLHFVQYWDDRLIAAGSEGVYSYYTKEHSWDRHFNGNVSVVLPFPNGRGFYFGFIGGVGVVSSGGNRPWKRNDNRCKKWELPYPHVNENITRLQHGKGDEVLALTRSGKLFGIDVDEGKVYVYFQGERTGLDPRSFHSAVAFGDFVLFTGAKKALIHNIITRTYRDIPIQLLPDWLKTPGGQFFSSGDQVYAAVKMKGYMHIYRISVKDLFASKFSKALRLGVLSGPVSQVRSWGDQGIGMIAGDPDDRVYRFHLKKEVLTGMKAMDINGVPFLDIAPDKNGIMVVTPVGIRRYNYLTRAWRRVPSVNGNSSPREVVQCGGRLWMSTKNGRLLELTGNKFLDRIGSEASFDMSDSQLSDSLEKDGSLYLGGNGWINCYDPGSRRITDRWDLPGNGDVRIVDVTPTGRPVTMTQGMALVGTQVLDKSAGPVLNLFIDNDYIWTVRQKKKNSTNYKYLKRYSRSNPLSSSGHCYFLNPYIGAGVRRILDAAALPGETLAVSTEKGLYFYNPNTRSWYASSPDQFSSGPRSRGGRLHVVGRYLVRILERQKDVEITLTDLDTLQIPTSCSTKPVIINEKSRKVRAFSLNPRGEGIAVINPNGAVVEWLGGIETVKLSPPGNQPPSGTFKRVFHHNPTGQPDTGSLLFTTASGVLGYDLEKRSWSEIPLNISLAGDKVKDINIETQGPRPMITVKTEKGRFFLDSIDSPANTRAAQAAKMGPVFTPPTGFNHEPGNLLDVQLRSKNRWTFVLKDRIKYYDPINRQWSQDIMIPGANGSLLYCQVRDRGVIIMNSGQGQVWWVARQKGYHPISFARYEHQPQPGETTALDNDGIIWRLAPGGQLFRLQQSLSGVYSVDPEPYEKPFLLDPDRVNGAFEWPGRVLFDTDDGIRILDRAMRKEMTLPENVKDIIGVREIVNDGAQLWISTRTGQRIRIEEIPGGITIPDRIRNQWSKLERHMVRLPNGEEVYDPITQLILDNDGRLISQRPSGYSYLAQSAALNPDADHLPDTLDLGWLKWNRDNKTFTIKTPTTINAMSPGEFIREGKLIFEEVDALVAFSPNRVHTANRYGIWNHTQQDLSLNDTGITFQPVQWRRPTGAAHGLFITPDGIYDINGNRTSPSRENQQVTIGDVIFTEPLRGTGIQGRIKQGSGFINAFAARGFAWDQDKQGLAYTSTHLLVHSDAGIHPVKGYTGFEPPPGQGRLYSHKAGEIFFKSGQTWYKRQGPSTWTKNVRDPVVNRPLVNNNTWKWEKRSGVVEIQLKGNAYNFKLISTGAGLAFTSDLLQDAGSVGNQLMVMTTAFFERAAPSSRLDALQADRFPSLPIRRFQTIRDIDKGDTLVLYTGSQYYVWNNTAQRFEQSKSGSPSYGSRLLAKIPNQNPRLRFTREPSGRINKELKVTHVTGKESWVPFNFWNRRLPFDVVTSIAASTNGEELYVGTRAGLQVYPGQPNTGLNDMLGWHQLRGPSGEPSAAVEKVGIPVNQPDIVIAYSAGECIEKPAGAKTFRNCTSASSRRLNQRLRYQTDFWRFIDNNGKLEGRYADQNGQYSPGIISIQQGHFPHDFIKDIAVHDNKVFTLWNNGWISRYNSLSIELDQDKIVNYNMQSLQPEGFIIGDQGLCIRGQGKRAWQYLASSNAWQEITDPRIIDGLLEYVQQPILKHQRLRLLSNLPDGKKSSAVQSKPPFTFEYRGLDGQWRALPWRGDGMEMDNWSSFLYLDNKLWAATSLGLVSYTISRKDKEPKVILDPDSFTVIEGPQKENQVLEITDIEAHDNIVTLRCDSNSQLVFQGTFDGQTDRDVFKPLEDKDKDPFASKILIPEDQNNFWEWTREGCKDFSPGRLEGKFRGEEVQLVGGRFAFDSINSFAFLQEDQMEIGTDARGWYRVSLEPTINFHISNFQRPKVPGINPTLVKEVRTSRSFEGETILGLRTTAEGFIRLGKQGITGKTNRFPQYLGSDGFWRYDKEDGEDKLSITTVKSSEVGRAKRQMENGRFTDDIILGLPVSGIDKQGGYYLLPTEAGILRLDERLNAADIYPKASLQSSPGPAPRVLYMDNHSKLKQALYLGQDGFHPIAAPGANIPGLKPLVPPGAVVLAVEDGPQDFVRFRWQKEKQRGWTLIDTTDPKKPAFYGNALYVHLKEFASFDESTQPWMQVRFFLGHMEFLRYGAEAPYKMDYPEPMEVLSAMVKGKQLLLIGKTNLWEINLEQVFISAIEGRR